MATKSYFTIVIVLAAVLATAWLIHSGTAAAGMKETGGMTAALKHSMGSMLLENLGIKAADADADSLMKPGKAVTGEVADPAKLSAKGFSGVKAGDKVELSNTDGKMLAVKHLATGKSNSFGMESVFGPMGKH